MWWNKELICSITFLSLTLCGVSAADTWFAPKTQEYPSRSRSHVFVVTPNNEWPEKLDQCIGVFYRLDGDRRVLKWKRNLVNKLSPVKAFASDSGRFVVTIDEWHELGMLPIVIYGPEGKLIKAHTLKSLELNPRDYVQSTSSLWWNSDAIMFFGPRDESFVIRFRAGKLLLIELSTGKVMDDEWFANRKNPNLRKQIVKFTKKRSAEVARQFLDSLDAEERKIGAIVAGELKLEDTVLRLRELLEDETFSIGNNPKRYTLHYHVREAAKNSLEALGEPPGAVVTQRYSKTYVAPRSSSRSLSR